MSSKSVIIYISISQKWTHTHTHGREPSPSLPVNHYHQCLFGTFFIISTISHAKPRKKSHADAPPARKTGKREVIVKCF